MNIDELEKLAREATDGNGRTMKDPRGVQMWGLR